LKPNTDVSSADPSASQARTLTVEPIGYVCAALATKVEAARQPRAAAGVPARIQLLPGRNFEHALADLDVWTHIWVLFWFDRNASWRP
jgi:tRNA (Thr-GGU) A37 N-methylase